MRGGPLDSGGLVVPKHGRLGSFAHDVCTISCGTYVLAERYTRHPTPAPPPLLGFSNPPPKAHAERCVPIAGGTGSANMRCDCDMCSRCSRAPGASSAPPAFLTPQDKLRIGHPVAFPPLPLRPTPRPCIRPFPLRSPTPPGGSTRPTAHPSTKHY
eukprot:Hpha_TRINITY_DN15501_c4_g4::TRINITY_DN15501_c4_g4_i1::g.105566::m.105566